MKEITLTNEEKLRLLRKTKELYVKQYIACYINNRQSIYQNYEPLGLCGCFFWACSTFRYEVYPSERFIKNIIPEWSKEYAYRVSPLGILSGCDYSSLTFGFWYPIWDKASRINYLNWLIDKYTKISTEVY